VSLFPQTATLSEDCRKTGLEKMQELGLDDRAYCDRRRSIAAVCPRIYDDGDSVTLQFQIGEIQSQMLVNDPYYLVLSYTRAMMAFLLFNREPKHIAVIGLGGGSIPKWCYRHLPATDITVVEINPDVIALREQFHIPTDDDRFRVICGDGADYVAETSDSPEALLVDGFDVLGQPPQLCSQQFYDDCYHALALMACWLSICAASWINNRSIEFGKVSMAACESSSPKTGKTESCSRLREKVSGRDSSRPSDSHKGYGLVFSPGPSWRQTISSLRRGRLAVAADLATRL
jgi:hypothetical protein